MGAATDVARHHLKAAGPEREAGAPLPVLVQCSALRPHSPGPLRFDLRASDTPAMTHDQAVAEADRLRREHPQRHRLVFAPRKRMDGDWEVVTARPDGIVVPEERQAEMRAGPQVTPDPTESQTPPIHGQRGF